MTHQITAPAAAMTHEIQGPGVNWYDEVDSAFEMKGERAGVSTFDIHVAARIGVRVGYSMTIQDDQCFA